MGSGSWSTTTYATYNTSLGRTYSTTTGRVIGQTYESKKLDESLNPKKFTLRECANSDEHPNTIPVILALDVTGSMGEACSETAAALGVIMTKLYEQFKDIEFCVMGIGDLAYDYAPIQMSQFESDVRIAEALDKIWMEKGGGGNGFESYTAAWYMGLKHTKLDCFDKQGRKGIIITMGDEPLNPYLPVGGYHGLNNTIGATLEKNVETNQLYKEACEKFDIYHIAVDSPRDCYQSYKREIENSFGQLLGDHFKVAHIDELANVITECIAQSVNNNGVIAEVLPAEATVNEDGEICW